MQIIEETLTSTDGTQLYARFHRADNSRAFLAFSHGLGEHIGRYQGFAERLSQDGISLFMADLHGHGRTGGRRGHFSNWEETLLDDLKTMLGRTIFLAEGKPVFFGGHSFGGLNAARLFVENPDGVMGGIIMSPAIRQTFTPPGFLLDAVKLVARIFPGLRLPNFLDRDGLSRDEKVVREYRADPLVHGLISVRALSEMLRMQAYVMEKAGEVKLPSLVIHGTEDRVTNPDATRDFFEKIEWHDKTLRLYEGFYHETHNDLDNEMVYLDLVHWIDSHLN